MPTSNRTGSVGAAVVEPSASRGRSREVEEVRTGLDALRPHAVLQDDRAVQQERARRSLQGEVGVDDRAEAVGVADRHAFAGRREADRSKREAVEADAAAERDVAAAETSGHLVDADAAGIERDGAVDRLERVRQREVAQPPIVQRRAAGEQRIGQRSRHLRLERGGPAAAQVAEEALEDAEVRVARCLDVDRLVLDAETAVELQLRSLAREPEPANLQHVLIERQLDRSVVVDPVVEELEIELLDPGLDDELIGVGELADDAHGAADDGRRVRREPRLEEAHVGIERRLAEPDRHLRVHLVCQRDTARAGDDETGRRRFEIEREQIAAQVQPPRKLTDAFVARKEVIHRQLHFVAWVLECPGAG